MIRTFFAKMSEREDSSDEESDEEDLLRKRCEQKVKVDEDDKEFPSDSILYFSMKLLIVYEILMLCGSLWSTVVTTHFGLL
jgi:accessory gene regulator protein AgrB